jgi:hypothetical protein
MLERGQAEAGYRSWRDHCLLTLKYQTRLSFFFAAPMATVALTSGRQ